ncbi:FimD/PapC C-terminal domain-containing protein [Shewanella algae]
MGSDVLGSEGEVLGVVGQAGLAYVRLSELSGSLVFRWGGNQQCQLNYSLAELSSPNLLRVPAVCE